MHEQCRGIMRKDQLCSTVYARVIIAVMSLWQPYFNCSL